MSTTIESLTSAAISRKHFTRNEYHFLADSGLLNDQRYELLIAGRAVKPR